MRFFAGVLATIIVAGIFLAACKSHDEKQPGHNSSGHDTKIANANLQKYPDGVNRVTVSELKEALANGDAVVVDVRGGPSFEVGHIKGAKLIPTGEISLRANELPRDKMIVTYCSWPNEHSSAGAVLTLRQNGIDNAGALLGGYDAWKNAGLPVETGR